MKQQDIRKGPLGPYQTTVAFVEMSAKITLPLPVGMDDTTTGEMWPADLTAWAAKHKKACSR